MASNSESKTPAFLISFGLHAALLALLFTIILHTPNPPFDGGSGVVLNLGYVDEGTGEVQTFEQPEQNETENKPQEEANNTVVEENKTEEDNLVTSDEPSDIQTETKEPTKVEDTKKVADPKPTESKEPDQKINTNALFGSKNTGKETKNNNNGDKVNKEGDQGDAKGDINAKSLYGEKGTGGDGKGGSGGGASLDLAGWKWDGKPVVKDDNEDENGKIVYEITIDDQGELIKIKMLETTVSPAIEKIYRKEVEKLSFSKTDNKAPASTATGKITFIIKVK